MAFAALAEVGGAEAGAGAAEGGGFLSKLGGGGGGFMKMLNPMQFFGGGKKGADSDKGDANSGGGSAYSAPYTPLSLSGNVL
jgi:hypothetical protein